MKPSDFLIACVLCLSSLARSATVLHTVAGDELAGEVTAIHERKLEMTLAGGEVRQILFGMVAALKVDGELINGPFDRSSLQARFPGLAAAPKETAASAAPDRPASARTPGITNRLKYGISVSTHYNFGPNGMTPSSSFTKMYSTCDASAGSEVCGEPRWIGFIGENLAQAVREVPEAKREADRIALTTGIQAVSLVATPVFLFSFVNLANGPKDENGKVQTHIGPGAMTCLILTGVSFANYIGWNIYEGVVARRAIRLYNQGPAVSAGFGPGSGSVSLVQRF